MRIGRLGVRQKLLLLVLPLLLLVIAAAVPLVTGRVQAAGRSADSAEVVERAAQIGGLVQALQQERLSSLGFLRGTIQRDEVVKQTSSVIELAGQLDSAYGRGDDKLSSVLRGVTQRAGLGGIRIQVLEERATPIGVYTGFTGSINELVAGLGLVDRADRLTAVGRQQLALDAIIRHDEAISSAGAALFVEQQPAVTPRIISLVSAGLAVEDYQEDVFVRLADPETVELYQQVQTGRSSTTLNSYLERFAGRPGELIGQSVPPELLQRVSTLTALSRLVGDQVAKNAVREADDSARRDRSLALLGVLVALVLVLGAAALAVIVIRSISRPLRRLAQSADEVADVAQQELVRVADSDDPEAALPQLRPVRVSTTDELGELAKAFNRVQQVAADLVERQLVSRRNVATMFGNVGRRTQNLVGRQLAMIDSLERNEQDPALLDRLYRLDHVSTRLRRNANSLVVLSGADDQQISGEPLSAADTVRSALGEIEGFQRVRLGEVDDVTLTPQVTPDLILLLAELLENGTSFSPPHTEVEVDAQSVPGGGVVLRVVDHGLGMTAEQLEAENGRLVSRERLDLAPTDVLGLFVVGRLARRHGIEVLLRPTPGTGVTAEVRVPARHVVGADRTSVPVGPARESDAAGSSAVAAQPVLPEAEPARDADGRGWWEPVADGGGTPSGLTSWAGAPQADGARVPWPSRVADGTVVRPDPVPGAGRADLRAVPSGTGPGGPVPPGRNGASPAGAGSADAADEEPPAEADGSPDRAGSDPAVPPGAHPRSDLHGPAANGARPQPQAPAGDGVRPEADLHGPAENGVRPQPQAPAGDGVRPEADLPGRDANGVRAVAEQQGPAVRRDAELRGPAGDRVRPGTDPRGPVEDGVRPGTDSPGPAGDGAGDDPSEVGGEPGAERAEPTDLRGLAVFRVPEPRDGSRVPPPGIVRRVRGAQLPDTGPRSPEPELTPAPSAEDARRAIEDFEAGVQRALHETGADGAALSTEDPGEAPWSRVDPVDDGSANQTRALVEEFEDGVRRALARLEEFPAAPAPTFFERRVADRPADRGGATRADLWSETPALGGATRADLWRADPPRPLDRRAEVPPPPRRVPESEQLVARDGRPGAADTGPASYFAARPRPADPPRPTAGQPAEPAPLPPRRQPASGTAQPQPDLHREPPAGAARPGPDLGREPVTGAARPGPEDLPPRREAGSVRPEAGVERPGDPEPAEKGRRIGTNGLPDRRRPVDPGAGPPPGLADLVRRVPGAQMPTGARAARPDATAPPPTAADAAAQEAAAARALVQEFEAGVQRALRDGDDRQRAETDEEDAR